MGRFHSWSPDEPVAWVPVRAVVVTLNVKALTRPKRSQRLSNSRLTWTFFSQRERVRFGLGG